VVTASGTGARVWDLSNGTPVFQRAVGPSGQVTDARFALEGDLVVLRAEDGVWTWRWKDANAPAQRLNPEVYTMAVAEDGRRLAGSPKTGGVFVWDLAAALTPSHSFQQGDFGYALAFDESGTRLAGVMDRTARVWNLVYRI
jgi:WD40 repeat protein